MVTSTIRRPDDDRSLDRGSVNGVRLPHREVRASMTVLPVTTMSLLLDALGHEVGEARRVGARCRAAICEVILRFASSGNGDMMSPLRSPASRCTTGICR